MDKSEDIERLADTEIRLSYFLAEQIKNSTTYFGYPEVPENNDLSILGISSLAKLHLNNAGDPWVHGNAKMHTKQFEQEALDFVADIYGIKKNYWGYITSGGTEGNLYGMYTSRDYFLAHNKTPIFLFTDSSHYSIPKNAHLLGLTAIQINSQPSGEMDYSDLRKQLGTIGTKQGIIINLNIGTTMTGAMDSLEEINAIIDGLGIARDRISIHADAALMGFIYPFLDKAEHLFKNGLSSIAISGHKFPGAIHPCGIVLTKKTVHEIAFGDQWVPYVGTQDTTISGSRNGFLALNLWYIFRKKGVKGFRKEGKQCIENAQYLCEKLKGMKYPNVAYFPNQIIVTFKKPHKTIVSKYQLATEGDIAHVVVMQHITKSRIDTFCKELQKSVSRT
ncbi:MAG: histidine decarboxylase [Bacteroidota bacterium]